MTFSSIENLLTTDDIFEYVVSPEDVIKFFFQHQKRIAEASLRGDDIWFFSSSECEVACTPDKHGSLFNKACIGCALVCRMVESSKYPGFFETDNKVCFTAGSRTFRLRKFPGDRDSAAEVFRMNSLLTKILEPAKSSGALLFCYECNGTIVFVEEVSNVAKLGFGFDLLCAMKRKNEVSRQKIDMLLNRIDEIDELLRNARYSLCKFNTGQISLVDENGELTCRILAKKSDTINTENPVAIKGFVPVSKLR